MARATMFCSSFESSIPECVVRHVIYIVGYKHLHNAASNGRAFQGTGVDSNFIPGGGTSLGGTEAVAFTENTLAEDSSLLEVCRE